MIIMFIYDHLMKSVSTVQLLLTTAGMEWTEIGQNKQNESEKVHREWRWSGERIIEQSIEVVLMGSESWP